MKIPVEDGYFRIPDDPEASPVLLGSYSPAAKTYFWPRRKRCPISLEAVEDCELSVEVHILKREGQFETNAGDGRWRWHPRRPRHAPRAAVTVLRGELA